MLVYFELFIARREWSEVKVVQMFTLEVNRTSENEKDGSWGKEEEGERETYAKGFKWYHS